MDICNNCKYFDMYSPRTLTGMCTCHDQYNIDASALGCYLFKDKNVKEKRRKDNLIKNNDVQIKMKLNKKSDDDILSLLQLVNKQGYIKQLIRDDVKSGKLYRQFLR